MVLVSFNECDLNPQFQNDQRRRESLHSSLDLELTGRTLDVFLGNRGRVVYVLRLVQFLRNQGSWSFLF